MSNRYGVAGIPAIQTTRTLRASALRPSAGSLMRWLHRAGYLSYVCLAFTKA
jgi:hypothetical protein